MPVSPELLEILVCPETKQPVAPATAEILQKLSQDIQAGQIRNRGGQKVTEPIVEGLLRYFDGQPGSAVAARTR